MSTSPPPPVLHVPGWEEIPGLTHGFYGRRGGSSGGGFAELNLSWNVGDLPAAVEDNWRRVNAAAGAHVRFVTLRQVHGARVVTVDPAAAGASPPPADAQVTRTGGLALGVLTADCVPLLLVAPGRRVVAAVHAGWRGTVAGIAVQVVRHLEQGFGVAPAELQAALGPAIGGCCYIVERGIVEVLQGRWGLASGDAGNAVKARLDLRRANAAQLAHAGVRPECIAAVGPCTRCAAADYFSHRAAGAPTGRQLSFIGWRR